MSNSDLFAFGSLIVAVASAVFAYLSYRKSDENERWRRDYMARQEQREEEQADRDRLAATPMVEVIVEQTESSVGFSYLGGPPPPRFQEITLRATNVGAVPVNINSVGFETNKGRDYEFGYEDAAHLPKPLEAGQHLTATASVRETFEDLGSHGDWVVSAYVRAAGGYRWRAEDLGPFLHMGKPPDE